MKILLANWEIKALAVIAAIIFWSLVVATENNFYTFPEEISVKAFNVPENLVLENELGVVKLRLKIDNRESIGNLTVDDFSAYIDLEETQVGEREIDVEVTSKRTGVNVVKVEPAKLSVKIADKSEKEVPLDTKVIGDPKDGYYVKDVITQIETVKLKGAEKNLADVNEATLLIELNGEDKDFSKKFKVSVLDNDENPIENISIDQVEAEAEVQISALSDQKVVGVQPTIVGSPQENTWIKSINVEPNFVVIKGDLSILENIQFLKTTDIDVSGLSENSQFTLQIADLPEGVEIEGTSSINVSIVVDKYNSVDPSVLRQTVKVPVLIRKFKGNQNNIQPDPYTLTLIVEGDDVDLSKTSLDLDLTEYTGKEAQIEVSESDLNLPGGVKVVSITPSTVNVTWE